MSPDETIAEVLAWMEGDPLDAFGRWMFPHGSQIAKAKLRSLSVIGAVNDECEQCARTIEQCIAITEDDAKLDVTRRTAMRNALAWAAAEVRGRIKARAFATEKAA
jgi:hypothetical protein